MTNGYDLSLSIQTFESLITGDFIYVDKTKEIYDLIRPKKAAYFFARPRRFGKSLTISTLDAIFSGKKELFKNLIITQTDYDWPIHPIIRLDMKWAAHPTIEAASIGLSNALDDIGENYNISLKSTLVEDKLKDLIQSLYKATKRGVVVLVDEYDKPLIDNLDTIEEAKKIQGLLKRFYGVLKSTDEYIRLVFITGVSKFSKVSVFSDLNHLQDISMDRQFSTLVGMTEEELLTNYANHIDAVAKENNTDRKGILEKIRYWYNGYQFSNKPITIYNPWSTLSLFKTGSFSDHWFQTGIPKLLIDIINRHPERFAALNPADFDLTTFYPASLFNVYDIETLEFIPLMVQTGFLTLKEYDKDIESYRLGYPNFEVRRAFVTLILNSELKVSYGTTTHTISQFIRKNLQTQNFDALITQLNSLIASIPGPLHTPKESYYHSLIHMIFQSSGLHIRSEEWIAGGRMDTVIEEPDTIYIIEFKFNAPAQSAIDQIKSKHYAEKFKASGKAIVAMGISVDCESKVIGEWVKERIK